MIKALLRKAVVSLLVEDSSRYPLVQVQYNEITSDATRMSVYGVSSQPPRNSLALIASPFCRVDDPIAIVDDVINRFKPLQEGEVQIGNYLTRSSIRFARNGDVIIDLPNSGRLTVNAPGGSVDVTSPTISMTGDVTVTGTLTASVDVVAGPLSTSLISHQHTETGTGGGTTTPPI